MLPGGSLTGGNKLALAVTITHLTPPAPNQAPWCLISAKVAIAQTSNVISASIATADSASNATVTAARLRRGPRTASSSFYIYGAPFRTQSIESAASRRKRVPTVLLNATAAAGGNQSGGT